MDLLGGEIVVRKAAAASVTTVNGTPNQPPLGACEVVLTNYRLVFIPATSVGAAAVPPVRFDERAVPLQLVQTAAVTRKQTVEITTGDWRVLRIVLEKDVDTTSDSGLVVSLRRFAFTSNLSRLFAFDFKPPPMSSSSSLAYSTEQEFKRLGLEADSVWRVTNANKDFAVTTSYGASWITPSAVADELLDKVAGGRLGGRVPVLSWKARAHGGAVLLRTAPAVAKIAPHSPQYTANKDITQAINKAAAHGMAVAAKDGVSAGEDKDDGFVHVSEDQYMIGLNVLNGFGSVRNIAGRDSLPSALNTPFLTKNTTVSKRRKK